ncbi:MAG: hypothetical protein Q9M29_03870, partial [Mariprofundaceae bacterium]|nr:hypothetical protein [Mariprofundaceae bacterium]
MSRANRRRPPARQKQKARQWRKHAMRLTAAAAVLIVAGGTGIWLNQVLSVSHWDIAAPDELRRPIEQQLRATSELDFLHSRPAVVRAALMDAIPDIAEVHVRRILPHSLSIQARARIPVALWQDTDGVIRLIDMHGVAYRDMRSGENFD